MPNTDEYLLITQACVVSWVSSILFWVLGSSPRCRPGSGFTTRLATSLEWQLRNNALPVTRDRKSTTPQTHFKPTLCQYHWRPSFTPNIISMGQRREGGERGEKKYLPNNNLISHIRVYDFWAYQLLLAKISES